MENKTILEETDGWNKQVCVFFVIWLRKNKLEKFKKLSEEYEKARKDE